MDITSGLEIFTADARPSRALSLWHNDHQQLRLARVPDILLTKDGYHGQNR